MTQTAVFDEHELGLSWMVEEQMQRASHALSHQGKVWLIDPIDIDQALERAEALGDVVAVLQLLDRHNRDCLAVSRRLDVPHLKVPDHIPASPFETVPVVRLPLWQETALWWPEHSALIVAEAIGTNRLYTAGRAKAGMHILLRPLPPTSLRSYQPEHLLVGHGPSLHGSAAADGIDQAYDRARRDIPQLLRSLPSMFK